MGKHVTEVDAIPRHFYQKAMHHLSTEEDSVI